MDTLENNAFEEDSVHTNHEYQYNFITIPWDDRTQKSKIGIFIMLTAIFVVTISLVINNLIIHYKGFDPRSLNEYSKIDCNLVKVDMYSYAARIHSITTQELICVGAVLSGTSVLANELCIRSGSVRIYLGSPTDPFCKKGFSVDAIEAIPHDGVVTKALVLLTTYGYLSKCARPIPIANTQIDYRKKAFIIGRPFRGGRSLSLQLATVAEKSDNISTEWQADFKTNKVICVRDLENCPVRAGDLLVQNGRLYGLASTSAHNKGKTKIACFANIQLVYKQIKMFDAKDLL